MLNGAVLFVASADQPAPCMLCGNVEIGAPYTSLLSYPCLEWLGYKLPLKVVVTEQSTR